MVRNEHRDSGDTVRKLRVPRFGVAVGRWASRLAGPSTAGPLTDGPPRGSIRTTMATSRRRARDLTRTYSRAQFAAKLRRFADAVESGRPFAIQVAGEKLRIPSDVTFNIEHERSSEGEELEFQVLWNRA
jgi:amphi-Trp domain-containing protein